MTRGPEMEIPNPDSTRRLRLVTKPLFTGLYTLVILLISLVVRPVAATTKGANGSAAPFSYDAAREVTLTGTVSSVLAKAAPGMIGGAHLLFATSSGPVDASLGRFGLRGKGAVSVAAGQQIDVTGVMKTIQNKPIFLVRSVRVGSDVYIIRNQHGFLLSPRARERAVQKKDAQ